MKLIKALTVVALATAALGLGACAQKPKVIVPQSTVVGYVK